MPLLSGVVVFLFSVLEQVAELIKAVSQETKKQSSMLLNQQQDKSQLQRVSS